MSDLQRINVTTATLPAHCPRCGRDFAATVVLVEDHPAAEPPIARTCDACLDAAEAACLAKLAAPPPATYHNAAPARRVSDE